jgi:hypothetical protein
MSQQLYDEIQVAIAGLETKGMPPEQLYGRISGMLRTLANVLTTDGHRAEHALIESWDDLTFAPDAFNPAGSAAPATIDQTDYPGTWLFSGSTENLMAAARQIPHAWKQGSTIRPHVHWAKTNTGAGEVRWEWRYTIANVGGDFPAYSEWFAASPAVTHADSPTRHALYTFPETTMENKRWSAMILMQIRRLPSHASDNYASAARLLEFDCHLLKNGDGSEAEYPEVG